MVKEVNEKKATLKACAKLLRRENRIDAERYNRMVVMIDKLQH